jgi:hypothetical protein
MIRPVPTVLRCDSTIDSPTKRSPLTIKAAVPLRNLPAFGGRGHVLPDFDLIAAIRKETDAADEALAARLLHPPDDAAGR